MFLNLAILTTATSNTTGITQPQGEIQTFNIKVICSYYLRLTIKVSKNSHALIKQT